MTYGIGTIRCNTPACIAGQIVASESELLEELRLQLDGEDLSDREAMDSIGSAIHMMASESELLEELRLQLDGEDLSDREAMDSIGSAIHMIGEAGSPVTAGRNHRGGGDAS